VEGNRQSLAAIVGAEQVTDDPATLSSFECDESFATVMRPAAVARPGSPEEVQQIVTWANETGTPLVPVSSGAPHLHGDTVPSIPGAVMLDLRRMDRILHIDRRNRMTVIEPGVTYPQLQSALAEHGMRVTPPLMPRANKSVVASLLERQPTLIPRYNYHLPEPLRDCGVVWGSGQTMFTGEAGGGPADLPAQWQAGGAQIEPKGPAQTDFYRFLTGAQGTMGVVTWASVKCELLPAARGAVVVPASRVEDLIPFLYQLNRVRLGDEVVVMSRACLSRALAAADEEHRDLPAWSVLIGLGGRRHLAEDRVSVQREDLRVIAAQHGLVPQGAIGECDASRLIALVSGCEGGPWKLAGAGGSCDVFFLSTLDKAPGFIQTGRELASSIGLDDGALGVYLQPQHQGVSWHVELSLAYDPADHGQAARARQFHKNAAERLIADGAYFSRPYGVWAQPVYDRDAASREALRKVKRIFDPTGIMNPGKLCFDVPAAKEA
jgi:FAD/FMN-containing dehydrogenase